MTEERKQKRMHVISYLKIHERNKNKSIGRVTDITTEGMGLYSQEPITPNRTYKFKLKLPVDRKRNKEICFTAKAVWCNKAEYPGFYNSGIQLLNVPLEDVELIEDFIQNSLIEDRWLAVTNCPTDK